MTRWKTSNIAWSVISSYDNSLACSVCLTPQQMAIIQSALAPYRYGTRWDDAGDVDTRDLIDQIMGRLDNGQMLRTDPLSGCTIQVSYDCGANWQTLIDVYTCVMAAIEPALGAQSQLIIDELSTLYSTGGVAGTYPDLVYDASGDDTYRDRALCIAWVAVLRAIINAELNRRAKNSDEISDFNAWVRSAFIGLGVVIPGAGWIGLAGTLFFGLGDLAGKALQALSDAELNNQDAILEVACCASSNMAGSTPSEASFYAALDGCTLSATAQHIRDAIYGWLSSSTKFELYLAFLQAWTSSFTVAKTAGVVCPCNPCDDVIVSFPYPSKPSWYPLSPEDFTQLGLGGIPYTGGYWLGEVPINAGARSVQATWAEQIPVDADGTGYFLRTTGYSMWDGYDPNYGYKLVGLRIVFDTPCTVTAPWHYGKAIRGAGGSFSGSRGACLLDEDGVVISHATVSSTGAVWPTYWGDKLWPGLTGTGVKEVWIWGSRPFSQAFCESEGDGFAIDHVVLPLS